MIKEGQVKESLEGVLVPGGKRSISDLNLVQEIIVSDHRIKITLAQIVSMAF